MGNGYRNTCAVLTGLIASLLCAGALPAHAERIGDTDACTPGFWKTHQESWEEYAPADSVASMLATSYGGASYTFPPELTQFQSMTMGDTLAGGGGPGSTGAAAILLRHAAAAFLNAAHEGLGYPLQRFGGDGISPDVRDALGTVDRETMLDLAADLDGLHNSLNCPL